MNACAGPLTITVAAGGWHDYESGIFEKTDEVHILDKHVRLCSFSYSNWNVEGFVDQNCLTWEHCMCMSVRVCVCRLT